MSIHQRRFVQEYKQQKLADKIEDAASVGINHIELCHAMSANHESTTIGIEELKINYRKAGVGLSQLVLEKQWIKDGELTFYPDRRGRRWGYLADTKYNRLFLAKSLKYKEKWFKIVDPKIEQEIYSLAVKNNINTILNHEDPLQHVLDKKRPQQKEKSDLEKKVAELEAKLEEEKQKNKKPLAGVSIDKSKLKKDSNMNNLSNKTKSINTSNVGLGDTKR